MSTFKYFSCFAGIALAVIAIALVATSPAKAAKPRAKLAPAVICNMERRLDIFVDEDGILWECNCQVLSKGFICHWQVIGGTDPIPKRQRKHLKPKRIIAYTIPAVVA